jgi:DNA polymerase/3'-5' exonuclease PolX
MNNQIIKEFNKLIEQIKIQIDIAPSSNEYTRNLFRLKQLSNAVEVIKKYPNEIKSGEELEQLKGIGTGTIARINEILKTGKLSEIKIKESDRKYSEYIEELELVHGIGHQKAYELVTKYNIKTVDELKKAYNDDLIELNNVILTGLKYHGIYQEQIPRDEITLINNYLNGILKNIDKNLSITICGSYRRLKPTSNDIDILLTHPKIKTKLQLKNKNYLLEFVRQLKTNNFILDDLTDKDYEVKYMGYCKYKNNPVRRIDIRYIPFESHPTALLYFTGSGNFNKRMRSLAEQLGYMLNEYGLYKLNGNQKIKIKISSEKDVFDALGMEYLTPEQRN